MRAHERVRQPRRSHPADALKALHARVRALIDPGVQVFGEWLYARHSIAYSALPSYFLAFGVRDKMLGHWASWGEVERCAEVIGVPTVPVLGRLPETSDARLIEGWLAAIECEPSRLGGDREGYVVRWAGGFSDEDFDRALGKWVRSDHVKTDEHWRSQAVVRNGLKTTR